jgi:hypothetical protein
MTRRPRLLALIVAVTATLALLGSPASAAPGGEVETNVFFRHLTLLAGGPTVDETPDFFLTADKAGWANEVTLSVDTSAAVAVVDIAVTELSPETTCATTDAVVRCTVAGPHRIIDLPESGNFVIGTSPSVGISLTPKAGATAGDAGAITVTGRADDGPTSSRTSTVRIGEGVDLTAVAAGSRVVAAGGSASLRPEVRNTGPRDVEGLTLVLSADDSTVAGTDYGNCTYDYVIACTFDATLQTGRAYRVSAPFTLRTPRDAAVGSQTRVNAQWLTVAEWQDWQAMSDGLLNGPPGTGPDLALDEVASASAVPQVDIDGDDNGTSSTLTVSGGQRPDVVAIGATLTGSPGETSTFEVGLVNRGPGTLHYPPFFNNLAHVDVTLPPGLSVVRADERCTDLFNDEDPAGPPPSSAADAAASAEPPRYDCGPDSMALTPGQRLSFAFTVRIDPAAQDGAGSIDVQLYDEDEDEGVDRDPGNNSAPIILRLGGGDGGLPVTGAGTATVVGGGVLFVLVGAAVTMAVRRRTRFVA